LIRYGGDPTIPGSHAISSIILGGTALISAPVPYVVTTVTAAAWDTTLKQFLFTTATPHLIVANEQMRVMAMTPASYNGVFSVIAVTPTTITAVYVSGIVPIPEPPAAATGMGVISDPNTTAANIAAAINANVPTQQMYSSVSYTSTSTAYVVIYEAMPYEYLYGSSTGRALAVSVTGDFTVTNIDDEMDTTIFNSFRVALSAGNFSSGTKFRVYQKGG
jgi:hypothetical protein